MIDFSFIFLILCSLQKTNALDTIICCVHGWSSNQSGKCMLGSCLDMQNSVANTSRWKERRYIKINSRQVAFTKLPQWLKIKDRSVFRSKSSIGSSSEFFEWKTFQPLWDNLTMLPPPSLKNCGVLEGVACHSQQFFMSSSQMSYCFYMTMSLTFS